MSSWFKYISLFVITVIFSTALIAFIYNIEVANQASTNIFNSPALANLNSSMSGFFKNFTTQTNSQYNASISEVTAPPTGAFVMFSILSSLGRFISLPFGFITDFFNALSSVLGVDAGILGIISVLILLLGIFLAYRFAKIAD